MMASETYYCPHCKMQLTKTDKAYLMGAAYENDSLIILDLPPDVICPGCGGSIDSLKMIQGQYDLDPVTQDFLWMYGVLAFVSPFILKFVAHWSWIPAIIAGLFGGIFAAHIIVEIIKLFKRKK